MRIPPFIMSKEAGRNRVTLWNPGCSFPCPESRWKGQPVPHGGCEGGGSGKQDSAEGMPGKGGHPEGPGLGGKTGYVTPITANYTISGKMGHPV